MPTYRRDIDGLRAIAVMAVVLNHAHTPGFRAGFLGVDIFFVISGFLITQILVKSDGTLGQDIVKFYERRIRRIVPALAVVLLAATLAALLLFSPNETTRFASSLQASTFFFANFHFMQTTNYFFVPFETPLLHLWSLGVEEQFYIVYPLALWTISRVAPRWLRPILLVLGVLSFALSLWWMRHDPITAFYSPASRAWELLIGALVALSPLRARLPQAVAEALAAAGLLLLAVPIWNWGKEVPWQDSFPWWACLGTALLLGLHDTQRTLVSRLLSTPPLVGIGLISYSLYLWHWPLFEFFRRWALHPATALDYAVLIAISIGLAALSWWFVERPFRRAGNRFTRQTIFAAASGCAVLFLSAGAVFLWSLGLPARFSPQVQKAYAVLPFQTVLGSVPQTDGGPCDIVGNSNSYDFAPCFAAARPKPAVVLWGDSHARSLSVGLAPQARASGVGLIRVTYAGCIPALTGELEHKGCEAFNRGVFAQIDARTSAVILVTRAFGRDDRLPSFAALVRALVAKHVPVIVVGPFPEYFEAVPFYVARYLQTQDPQILTLAQAEIPATSAFDGKLRAMFAGLSGVTYLSPLDALCHGGACPLTIGDLPSAVDGHHLTKPASKALAAALWPHILPMLHR